MFARLNLHNVVTLNRCPPLRLPLTRELPGGLRERRSKSQQKFIDFPLQSLRRNFVAPPPFTQGRRVQNLARFICLPFLSLRLLLRKIHLPRQREAKVTIGTVVLNGRTQFAPNIVKFTLRFCSRDAEDVVPYDLIKNFFAVLAAAFLFLNLPDSTSVTAPAPRRR